MQNILLLGLQNNCFLTSQIRLSWKTKLLLLISHGPHAHMQHLGNLVGRSLGVSWGCPGSGWGFRGSPTTWRVLAPRGKAPRGKAPRARGCDPSPGG